MLTDYVGIEVNDEAAAAAGVGHPHHNQGEQLNKAAELLVCW